MRSRSRWVSLGIAGSAFAVAVWDWWASGGQHWAAYQTGTLCGSTGERYCYWSGFGSVIPWSLLGLGGIFTAVAMHWRHVNCHERGCLRVGRFPAAGGAFKFCHRHHPDFGGRPPSRVHMHHHHRSHQVAAGIAPPEPDLGAEGSTHQV